MVWGFHYRSSLDPNVESSAKDSPKQSANRLARGSFRLVARNHGIDFRIATHHLDHGLLDLLWVSDEFSMPTTVSALRNN